MDKEKFRTKIHRLVDSIDDETALQSLMEDVANYSKQDVEIDDNLSAAQWAAIEAAREQIKNGQFKTYESVKEHFSQWLTR